jgi:4-hydroxy-4-methyl-2-oxoglutarate aldolase
LRVINDPPLLTLKRTWVRPAASLLAMLADAQTGHVIDAMLGRGALDAAIKPLDPTRAHFVGAALPCESFANDNLAILAAIAVAKPGDALIVQADAFGRTAVVGDNVTMMAKNAGITAIVVDGMARDIDGIIAAGLPVHARGITPNSCVKTGPGRVGFGIVAGGMAVQPGDVLVGDRDGVAVIPQAELQHVLSQLDEIRRLEGALQTKIRAGLTHPDAIAAMLTSDRVRWVD